MKLVKRTLQNIRVGKPTINITKSGVIRISSHAVKEIGLVDKEEINFYQDEDNPSDWYLIPEKDGLRMRASAGDGSSLLCNSAGTAKNLLKSVGMTRTASMLVATEPIEGGYYAIITSSVKGE